MGGRSSSSGIAVRSNSNILNSDSDSLGAKYSQSDVNRASDNASISRLNDGNERITASLGNEYSTSINIIRVPDGYKVEGFNTVFPYITGARNLARRMLHQNLMKATGRA